MTVGSQPSLSGFISFLGVLNVPATAGFSPTTDPTVTWCYDAALQTVNCGLQAVPAVPGAWSQYARAVYFLAADFLVGWEQDPPSPALYKDNLPYWAWLRQQYGVNNFVAGVVNSTSDEGTSMGLTVPEAFSAYTIANLQNLKTPYGRAYLGIAQSWGTQWGMS